MTLQRRTPLKRTGFKDVIRSQLQRTEMKRSTTRINPVSNKTRAAKNSPEGKYWRRYVAVLHDEPCIVCQSHGLPQNSPTQVHHPIMGRFSTRRAHDKTGLPVCEGHHQGLIDTSQVAIHREPERFKELFGPDTDYVAIIQDRMEKRGWDFSK